jgi:hypothetical protein
MASQVPESYSSWRDPKRITGAGFEVVSLTRIPLRWPNIGPVAEHVSFCVGARSYEERGQRAGAVVHELMENAVKYGDLTRDVEVEVRMPTSGTEFAVRVRNRASPGHVDTLRRTLAALAATSAEKAFLEAMTRAASLPAGTARLGLARIRHECRVSLSLEEERDMVTVVATG